MLTTIMINLRIFPCWPWQFFLSSVISRLGEYGKVNPNIHLHLYFSIPYCCWTDASKHGVNSTSTNSILISNGMKATLQYIHEKTQITRLSTRARMQTLSPLAFFLALFDGKWIFYVTYKWDYGNWGRLEIWFGFLIVYSVAA